MRPNDENGKLPPEQRPFRVLVIAGSNRRRIANNRPRISNSRRGGRCPNSQNASASVRASTNRAMQ